MNDMSRSHHAPPIADVFARDGFFFPYDVISEAEAAGLLADLEAAEAELADRSGAPSFRCCAAIPRSCCPRSTG